MAVEDKETLGALRQAVSRRTAVALAGAALGGAAGLSASAGAVRAEHDGHAGHDHGHDHTHDHGAHDSGTHGGHGRDSQHQALIDAAMHCVAMGEACVPHCVELMANGDPSLGECLESVLVMMPMCTAVARAARFDASRFKAAAQLCGDICADCEAVCRKHAEHHAVCKACADACAAFVKEAKKLAG